MLGFLDFVTTCDMCHQYVGTENLTEVYDKQTGDDWYFCKDCMKEVRKIRKQRRADKPENTQD